MILTDILFAAILTVLVMVPTSACACDMWADSCCWLDRVMAVAVGMIGVLFALLVVCWLMDGCP